MEQLVDGNASHLAYLDKYLGVCALLESKNDQAVVKLQAAFESFST
ncbi:MAG: hypothetical protein HQ472_10595 [Ignavibacteria bacterium]|nr:hypothetical protein [Ignavibacteria bacterium]